MPNKPEPSLRDQIMEQQIVKLRRLNRIAEQKLLTREEVAKALRKMGRTLADELKTFHQDGAIETVRQHLDRFIADLNINASPAD
jgi:hypothetical protein